MAEIGALLPVAPGATFGRSCPLADRRRMRPPANATVLRLTCFHPRLG